MQDIDFIGDVHGQAAKLERLLHTLGYRLTRGAWWHPSRTAVFVGDLVDRGLEQLRTVQLVRAMVDAGSARCLLGNHEHNAIGWLTPDPANPGEFLRTHKDFHRKQHVEFLDEVGEGSALHHELVNWFKTLPVLLEIQGVRVAHACWDERVSSVIEQAQGPDGSFGEAALLASLTKGTELHNAVEVVTKGPEARLPAGASFVDHLGKLREHVRIAWWHPSRVLHESALPMPGLSLAQLPAVTLHDDHYPVVRAGTLHVFGHYWMSSAPAPLQPHLISVDYSGLPDRPLTAYRWQGEREFRAEHFLQVP